MVRDGRLYYDNNEEVKIGDYISVQTGPNSWVVLELNEVVAGQEVRMTPKGEEIIEHKQLAFIGHGELQGGIFPISQEIASAPMRKTIEAEFTVVEVDTSGEEVPNESSSS